MTTIIRTARRAAFAAALTSLVAASARAQGSAAPSWDAWIGCWQPVEQGYSDAPAGSFVCVRPTNVASAVEIVTVGGGKILARDTLDAGGKRQILDAAGCTGWRSAQWSPTASRVYVRSEIACPGGLTRRSTGIMAFSPGGDWIDVQSASAGGKVGVRTTRYREVGAAYASLPPELANAIGASILRQIPARVAASAEIEPQDVIDAVKAVDAVVVQAWLAERGEAFDVDAHALVALAGAGVPGSVTDVLIGLANPRYFSVVAHAAAPQEAPEPRLDRDRAGVTPYDARECLDTWDPYWNSLYAYDPCSYRYRYGYGAGYSGYGAYGYYTPGYYGGTSVPVVIVRNNEPPHGEVIKGRGYTRGPSGSTTNTSTVDASGGTPARGASSSGGSAGRASGSGSGSSSGASGGARTAHVKPPPPQ